jgi:hypothetical protein
MCSNAFIAPSARRNAQTTSPLQAMIRMELKMLEFERTA